MDSKRSSRKSEKKMCKQGALTYRQKLFKKNINKINIKIGNLKDNEFVKFKEYSLKLLFSTLDEKKINRNNFLDRSEYNIFKNDNFKFFYCKCFKPTNNNRYILNIDLYTFTNHTFDDEIVSMVENFILKIDECLNVRKYDPLDSESIYNPDKFNESLEILEISDKIDVKFSHIRKQYEKKKEFSGGNSELKTKINSAYILLRNQYENFLKNRPTKLEDITPQIDVNLINNEYINKLEQ